MDSVCPLGAICAYTDSLYGSLCFISRSGVKGEMSPRKPGPTINQHVQMELGGVTMRTGVS